MKINQLKKIHADKLFPEFLSSKQKRLLNVEDHTSSTEHLIDPSFNLESIVSDLIDPRTGKMRELVDTRSLPEAKNFFDYCVRIIGSEYHLPWARQMWTASMLLQEVCPRCTSDKYKDIKGVPKKLPTKKLNTRSRMTFLEHGVCPRCGVTKQELLKTGELNRVNQGVIIWGQRSGKSSTAAFIASYLLHRYLMYPMLATMTTSMQASTELVIVFCSLTANRAFSTLWAPFKQIIDASSWFKSYTQLLDTYEEQYGKKLYKISDTYVAFANKNIRCYFTGPKASTLRGSTSIMAVLDELGLFTLPNSSDGELQDDMANRRADADEAYTSLLNSLTTVDAAKNELLDTGVNDAPPCMLLSVSSPISKRDKISRLYNDSKIDNHIFGIRLPTWEVNPYLTKDSPIIASKFLSDPKAAMRDFGAQPMEGNKEYFSDQQIYPLFKGTPNSHILSYSYSDDKYAKYVSGTIRQINSYPGPTVMALDAGLTNNSFAIAVVGYNNVKNITETVCVLEIMAYDGYTVDFEKTYRNVILPLAKSLNTCFVAADRWNSVDHLHRIKSDMGKRNGKPICYTKQYSLKLRDFENCKSMMTSGIIQAPYVNQTWIDKINNGIGDYKKEFINYPVQHLMFQLLTVQDAGNLCPTKAEGLTDDIARAWILAVTAINNDKVQDWLEQSRKYVTKRNTGLGVVVMRR